MVLFALKAQLFRLIYQLFDQILYIDSFEKSIVGELEYLEDMFSDIYDEIIPDDFWEVKSKVN